MIWKTETSKAENGDIFLPIPDEALAALGWKEGDSVTISRSPDGELVVSLVEPGTPESEGAPKYRGHYMSAAAIFCFAMALVAERMPTWAIASCVAAMVAVGIAVYLGKYK